LRKGVRIREGGDICCSTVDIEEYITGFHPAAMGSRGYEEI
jgi:hypothetical protein